MADDEAGKTKLAKVPLPDFPGERVLSHQGRIWKKGAITAFAPYGYVITAETGRSQRLEELIDIDIDVDFPMVPQTDRNHTRIMESRSRAARDNKVNAAKRIRYTFEDWTAIYNSCYNCCLTNAPSLASELFDLCALSTQGVSGGHFDGPRAWRILNAVVPVEGARSPNERPATA